MPIKGVLLEAKMSAGIDITSRSLPNHVRVHFSRVLRREESLPRYCFGSSWLVLCTSWLVCPEVKPDSTSHRSWSDSPRFRCHLFGLTPSSLPSGSDTGADSISGVRADLPLQGSFRRLVRASCRLGNLNRLRSWLQTYVGRVAYV